MILSSIIKVIHSCSGTFSAKLKILSYSYFIDILWFDEYFTVGFPKFSIKIYHLYREILKDYSFAFLPQRKWLCESGLPCLMMTCITFALGSGVFEKVIQLSPYFPSLQLDPWTMKCQNCSPCCLQLIMWNNSRFRTV